MSIDNVVEIALKRDKYLVLGALVVVMVLAWAYVLAGAGMGMSAFEMTRMTVADGGMAMMKPWRKIRAVTLNLVAAPLHQR